MPAPETQPGINILRGSAGFTLIEVLIVVAIMGILAAIAYPQYGSYVSKARRSDGHLALLQEVQTMERCKSTRYSFANCSLANGVSPESYYALSLVSASSTYTITATGQGKQAQDSECATMTINHLGVRTPDPDLSNCWPD